MEKSKLYILSFSIALLLGCSDKVTRDKVTTLPIDVLVETEQKLLPCNLPSKSISSFEGDTTAYFSYNLTQRVGCYQGKTLKYLLTTIDFIPKSYIPDFLSRNRNSTEGLYLDFHETDSLREQYATNKVPKTSRMRLIYIEFNNTIPKDTSIIVIKHGPWNNRSTEYYNQKIVKNITLMYK